MSPSLIRAASQAGRRKRFFSDRQVARMMNIPAALGCPGSLAGAFSSRPLKTGSVCSWLVRGSAGSPGLGLAPLPPSLPPQQCVSRCNSPFIIITLDLYHQHISRPRHSSRLGFPARLSRFEQPVPGLEVFSSGLFGSGWFHTVLGLLCLWLWALLGCSRANLPPGKPGEDRCQPGRTGAVWGGQERCGMQQQGLRWEFSS